MIGVGLQVAVKAPKAEASLLSRSQRSLSRRLRSAGVRSAGLWSELAGYR